MKAGITTSALMHAAIIGFGLVSLSSPRQLEVADVESLPVDIIPIEQLTQIQKGDREAPVEEKAAPKPVKRPDIVENAENPGENKIDLKTPPVPESKPEEIKTAAAPPPDPKPRPSEKPEAKPAEEQETKAEPVPATELKPEPAPKQDVAPDPADKPAEAENPEAEVVQMPDSTPIPERRPQPPKAQTAKAPERKDSESKNTEKTQSASSQEKSFNKDEIAALLNKQDPSGGGAARPKEKAALGGNNTNRGQKLTQSEMDALRGQIQRCWNVTFAGADGADTLKVSIKMRLDPSGAIEGQPEVVAGGGQGTLQRIASESARRAVLRCAPYNLPAEKYDSWSEVLVHFDPSDMF